MYLAYLWISIFKKKNISLFPVELLFVLKRKISVLRIFLKILTSQKLVQNSDIIILIIEEGEGA